MGETQGGRGAGGEEREEEEEAGEGRDSFIDRGNKHLLSSENTIKEREKKRCDTVKQRSSNPTVKYQRCGGKVR